MVVLQGVTYVYGASFCKRSTEAISSEDTRGGVNIIRSCRKCLSKMSLHSGDCAGRH